MKRELVALGCLWIAATFVAGAALASHFAHTKGRASVEACAYTGYVAVLLGVVFVVAALTEIARER